MKKTLSTKKEVTLKDMSVDDMDYCDDVQFLAVEPNGNHQFRNTNASNTAWIRKGVVGADDKFLKSLTFNEKLELVALVKEHNTVGE